MKKQLWLLAGGNGSGKSTFYDRYLKKQGIAFVNADVLAKKFYSTKTVAGAKSASQHAQKIVHQNLAMGKSFCFETVFSHDSKIKIIQKAKRLGYEVCLVYIHLSSPELNQARVLQRVKEGGHDVPPKKIISRIPKTFENIKEALLLVDKARILDNSKKEDGFKPMFKVENGTVSEVVEEIPAWCEELINSLSGKQTKAPVNRKNKNQKQK